MLLALFFLLAGCAPVNVPAPATPSPLPTPTRTPSPLPTPSAQPDAAPSITPQPLPAEPAGCVRPPDDLTRVTVNGWTLNQRTHAMLQHAALLYGGELDITNTGITQGSYHDNGEASFGTHLGGGAVDLSVMRPGTYQVLTADIAPLIAALRTAGFAAWLRVPDEVYPGSVIHIHAVAIGDPELSRAAQQQLWGPFGYLHGFTGIPQANATPQPDRHGGPVICNWMRDLYYPLMLTLQPGG